jgi:hypothetical protein
VLQLNIGKAYDDWEYDYDDEEQVMVKESYSTSVAATRKYGDLRFTGYEWCFVILGTILLNRSIYKLNEDVELTKKMKYIYGILIVVGLVLLYPCIFGLYHHFRIGAYHVFAFAMLLIPFGFWYFFK